MRYFEYLDKKLEETLEENGLTGDSLRMASVVALLTYDKKHKRINVYSEHDLSPFLIFHQLNLTIGTQGTKLTGVVNTAEKKEPRFESYRQGHFVEAKNFGYPNSFIALGESVPLPFETTIDHLVLRYA